MRERDEEEQEVGSDLEQIISMLERSEIDYLHQYEGEDSDDVEEMGSYVDINDTVRMSFDEEGNLLEVNPIPN
jgi:thiamine phosphate synthase YjbQ (UPF0047 family)